MKRVIPLFVFAALLALRALEFGTPFADGMVLQRGRRVSVWGKAASGGMAEVSFAEQTKEARADAQG